MPTVLSDDLSRTRALFEQWRATRSGLREKIPEQLWQAAIALRDRYPVSQLCRELHLSAGRCEHVCAKQRRSLSLLRRRSLSPCVWKC
jgi:hypothetical protein